MNLRNAWTVAGKDLRIFRKKRSVVISTVLYAVLVAIGLPLVVRYAGANSDADPMIWMPGLLNAFSWFWLIGAAVLPTGIASYSLVGEKVEKSMEPLLATPVTDGEILLGKTLSALIPPIAAIWAGGLLFMELTNSVTSARVGVTFFPNWTIGIIMLLAVPLASLLCVGINVLLSSRMSDVRAVQQLASVMVMPFAFIYVAAEIGYMTLDTNTLFLISAVLVVADVLVLSLARATFKREEILTRWR